MRKRSKRKQRDREEKEEGTSLPTNKDTMEQTQSRNHGPPGKAKRVRREEIISKKQTSL